MKDELNVTAAPKNDDEVLLRIENLTVYFEMEEETVKAVNGVTLSLKRGTTLGMVGETGAGKTTTALAALNLIPSPPGVIKSGSINLCGHDVLNLPAKELDKIRGKEISMIFQDPMTSLNPVFTVGQQIAETIKLHEPLSEHEAYEKAKNMLEMVGIRRERAGEYPHQFSGGMKQRVMIAIALACNPDILLADEPTTALDVTVQAQILDLIEKLRKERSMSIIIISHNMGIIAEMCNRMLVMYGGVVVEEGDCRTVFSHPLHPYTVGLLGAIPSLTEDKESLETIPGIVPVFHPPVNECRFASRCPYASEKCRKKEPPLLETEDGRKVRCWKYADEGCDPIE